MGAQKNWPQCTVLSLFAFVFPSAIYKSKSFRNDVHIVFWFYTFYAVVLVLVTSLESKAIIGMLFHFLNSGFLDHFSLSSYKDLSQISLAQHLFFTFLVILVYDFGYTSLHFAFHKVPFLWRFHKVHHSAEVLAPLTVAMHQIHHSNELRHRDKNLAQIFSFWDYLFGTMYIPKERETFSVALSDETDWKEGGAKKFLGVHFRV